MTMWGFSSRKEQDSSTTASTENSAGDSKQPLSPSKRARRRIGGRRRNNEMDNSSNNNTSKGDQEKASGNKKLGPLGFGRNKQQQSQPNTNSSSEQALRTSRMMNQRETTTLSHYDQQQDINVDDSDDGQGIEILLDYNAARNNYNNDSNNNNNNTTKSSKSPTKGHHNHNHHSRRSMSNHNHKGHRSAPPDSKRPEHEHPIMTRSGNGNAIMPVVSLEKDILVKRTKIYRAQFSVFFPVPTRGNSSGLTASWGGPHPRHRVPLGGRPRNQDLSYQDVISLLQNANPVDELTSVRVELKKTKAEMDALEEDKEGLKRRWKSLKQQQTSAAGGTATREQLLGKQLPTGAGLVDGIDWDIHRLLNSQRKMGLQERLDLEQTRGRCITVYLQNPRAEDAFLNKCCGAKQPLPKTSNATTMNPLNCRAGGAGATIRHLALLPRGSSFFVSRDNGKSYSWGQLPPRLLQRMKTQGLDPVTHCGDLMYLSTGPNGYYFAEFRSGECWWGCAGEDKEFYEILKQWEIYRVVFGSTVTHTTPDGREIITNSWIILARDGRAAWKNLPSRLHHTLENRLANSAAPAEISLGSGESYYVRFLDGTVDYCLPAEVASVCEHIQRKGGTITDMAMNPEVSHEFMVRHTEVPSR